MTKDILNARTALQCMGETPIEIEMTKRDFDAITESHLHWSSGGQFTPMLYGMRVKFVPRFVIKTKTEATKRHEYQ